MDDSHSFNWNGFNSPDLVLKLRIAASSNTPLNSRKNHKKPFSSVAHSSAELEQDYDYMGESEAESDLDAEASFTGDMKCQSGSTPEPSLGISSLPMVVNDHQEDVLKVSLVPEPRISDIMSVDCDDDYESVEDAVDISPWESDEDDSASTKPSRGYHRIPRTPGQSKLSECGFELIPPPQLYPLFRKSPEGGIDVSFFLVGNLPARVGRISVQSWDVPPKSRDLSPPESLYDKEEEEDNEEGIRISPLNKQGRRLAQPNFPKQPLTSDSRTASLLSMDEALMSEGEKSPITPLPERNDLFRKAKISGCDKGTGPTSTIRSRDKGHHRHNPKGEKKPIPWEKDEYYCADFADFGMMTPASYVWVTAE